MRHVLSIPLETSRSFHISNTSLSIVQYIPASDNQSSQWSVRTMGDVWHVRKLAALDGGLVGEANVDAQ